MEKKRSEGNPPGSVFKVGGIALAFLIIGYQSALFMHRAVTLRVASRRDAPDTVYVVDPSLAARLVAEQDLEVPREGPLTVRRNASHAPAVQQARRSGRHVENFRFNPNTVSGEDLERLGFTEKQAQAILNYRAKGGRFRRKSDFAKSFVVSDSVYKRLEPYINIPKVDINRADSAAFDDLPGIGPYFAAKMVEYRSRLGGYSYKEQLMDIHNFDSLRFKGLSDLIVCSPPARPFRLWSLPEDSLRLHPYIRSRQAAHSIVLYRNSTPRGEWSVQAIAGAYILPPEDAARLARCVIANP